MAANKFKVCSNCETVHRLPYKSLVCYNETCRYGPRGHPLSTVTSFKKRDGTIVTLGSSMHFIEVKP